MHRLIRLSAALLLLGLGSCSDLTSYDKLKLGRRIM